MASSSGVLVSVEPQLENAVIEVTAEGQIVAPPLSMEQHLARQAAKVDFSQLHKEENITADDEDENKDEAMDATDADDDDDESSDDDTPDKTPTSGAWPWESTRNKLRDALTELSVLSDVMTVATKDCGKDPGGQPKRYMVLDGPVAHQEQESRPYVVLLAKKKSLDLPAKILLSGAEHLRALQSENKTNATAKDFHFELLKLRQNWRLKKVSNTILGDLSYRTAGSHYKQSGVFEVVKSDAPASDVKASAASSAAIAAGLPGPAGDEPMPSTSAGPAAPGAKPSPRSTLKVNVPSGLEGIAYIQVTIQKESEHIVTAGLSQFGAFGAAPPSDMHWQKKLEAAQNVLFCKELFSQLAKEAIQLQAPIPHMVVGNQITASLFSDIQLIISLCHSTGNEKKRSSSGAGASSAPPQSQRDHLHVLEHSLHQLLRLQHSRNINPDSPCLSSAPVGISKKRRLAGPRAADRAALLLMANTPTLLEQIIQQAQHVVLRLRTIFLLDTFAKDLKDPLITCHWGTLSSPTRTSVKVTIVTAGYDYIHRTLIVIHVGEKQLTVICKDGKVLQFSHEPQELRDFILCQISQHQLNGVQALAKCTGWTVLSSSTSLGCGPVEPLGNATGCLLASPAGDRFIAVRHSPQTHTSVWISGAPAKDFYPGTVLKDNSRKWEQLPDSYQEVRLDKMDGKNLLNKLDLLMAALSTPTPAVVAGVQNN